MLSLVRTLLSVLLVCLLAVLPLLPCGAPAGPVRAEAAREALPEGLLRAVLAASAQPLQADGAVYRGHSGHLEVSVGPAGLEARAAGLAWELALRRWGRGEALLALPRGEVVAGPGRVEQRRGALTEWYRDTALGLEQGFTVEQAPGGQGPLLLELEMSGGERVTADADGRGLEVVTAGGTRLRYDHLSAWDAGGVSLEATLRCGEGWVTLEVQDQGAAYPITVDPLVYLEQKVIAPGAAQGWFGSSVALWGDTALVGAPGDGIGANANQGSGYVFVRSGTTWSLQARLTAADGAASDNFGSSVALSGDTALVGAPWDDVGGNADQGSAYIFVRSGMTWTQEAQLTAGDGASGDAFGISVALSGDTALVGAPWDDIGADVERGSAYAFLRSGTTWTQQAQLTAADGASGDYFGAAVALWGDTALVGASADSVGANTDQGSAYVFVRSGTTWSHQAQLTAGDGEAGDAFGNSVALSGDTALVGASADGVGANANQGSAYVFVRSGSTWSEQAQLTAADGAAEDLFGSCVAVSADTALVGAPGDDIGADADRGSAYAFLRSGTTWTQQAQLTAADGAAGDYFGAGVALWGETALVGAFWHNVGGNADQGSAYVFLRSGTTWTQQAQLTSSAGEAEDGFGTSVALWGDTALVGVPRDDVGGTYSQGSVYVFVRSGTTWSFQAQLTAADGATTDAFGNSVALWGETALVGAQYDDAGGGSLQGSAYVFVRSGTAWSQQAKLTAADGEGGDIFGVSVALWGDTALVGAYMDDVGGPSDQGSAYVFVRSGTTWGQQAQLTAADHAWNDYFGYSVALSGDTALVGACADDVGANYDQGSAYVFVRSGTTWSQQAQLTAADGAAYDQLGSSVALSGETALVGAYGDDAGAGGYQGSACVFVRSGTTWSFEAQLTAGDGAAGDRFGSSVALSGDTALVGAGWDTVSANAYQGSAYLFVRSGTTWSQQVQLIASDGAAGDMFGGSVALSGNRLLVGAYGDDIGSNTVQGSAYFYSPVFRVYLPLTFRGWP